MGGKKTKKQRQRNQQRRAAKRATRTKTPPRARGRGGPEILGLWATPPLARRVSGRSYVAASVRHGSEGRLILAVSRMLAGGYLGTMAAVMEGASREQLLEKPFETIPGGLCAVDVEEARALLWAPFAWSLRRELFDDSSAMRPGLHTLAPPRGGPDEWERHLARCFDARLLDLAEEIADSLPDDGENAPIDRPDVLTRVLYTCITERPLSLARELDRLPFEFRYDPEAQMHHWRARAQHDAGATIEIRGERVRVLAYSAEDAATSATRLEELSHAPLTYATASWTPVLAEKDDAPEEPRIITVGSTARRGR